MSFMVKADPPRIIAKIAPLDSVLSTPITIVTKAKIVMAFLSPTVDRRLLGSSRVAKPTAAPMHKWRNPAALLLLMKVPKGLSAPTGVIRSLARNSGCHSPAHSCAQIVRSIVRSIV